ncbi:HAD-IIB family hydrolase [Mycoplasma sp. 4423]
MKNRVKKPYVFAFDLDGTLLQSNNKAHIDTIKALKKSKEHGHINVIATGRGITKTLPLLDSKAVDHIDYLVCSNGTALYDIKNQKAYILNSLDKDIFYIMRDIASKHQLIITVDTHNYNATALPNNQKPHWITDANIMDMNILNQISIEKMQEVIENKDVQIVQIALRNPLKSAKEITDLTKKLLKDFECNIYLTNSIYTDVNPINTSKLIGLEYLLNLLNLTTKNLVTFGDSGNDIDMTKHASLGIAMGNATADLKDVAAHIINDHNSATIGEFITSFLAE